MRNFIILFFLGVLTCSNGQRTLEQYNIDPSHITVSGLSAGGAMAMQFHVAYSRYVSGAGIFAGLPYSCAKSGLMGATYCMSVPAMAPSVATMLAEARSQSNSGNIDNVDNLAGSRAYIFHGTSDYTVLPANADKMKEIYESLGTEVHDELGFAASHGFPTDNYGVGCSSSAGSTQYIINCGYKGAFEMLNFLHGGGLDEPDNSVTPTGDFFEFDQNEFTGGQFSMDSVGYAYVPTQCQDKSIPCGLHIAFHGCLQSKSNAGVGDKFARNAGYLQAAELNNIIVLFPQAKATLITNPNACYEWWPYLNSNFLNKNGGQMKSVFEMMMRVITGA